jgi:hypothetical protein
MVCFQTKNSNFGKIGRALEWTMPHNLEYFTAIWYNLLPFGAVCCHLVYLLHFGMFPPRKIWQPWCHCYAAVATFNGSEPFYILIYRKAQFPESVGVCSFFCRKNLFGDLLIFPEIRQLCFSVTRDRCYDFKNIFAKKLSKNIGVFCSNYC